MNKGLYIGLFFLQFLHPVFAQEIVGMNKADILITIQQSYPDLIQDNMSINNTYKYLKFEDNIHQETLFCFLSADDVCTKTMLMSDYMNLNKKLKLMNKKYKKRSSNTWNYTRDGIDFTVELKKEEWYFTLITKRKQMPLNPNS